MPALTPSQQRAIEASGNVLVMAGAGTGKTRTLVERCLARVLAAELPVSLERVLMVTFTDAAAAEMRARIRQRLGEECAQRPASQWLAEQFALVDAARICTLHSFCLQLAREHFHELGLDPQLVVLDPAQTEILAGETLEDALQRHYAGHAPFDEAVRQLILTYGRGHDQPVRELVRRVHNYTQTLPDPEGWRRAQREALACAQPPGWEAWLREYFSAFCRRWLEVLRPVTQPNLQRCAAAVATVGPAPTRQQISGVCKEIRAADQAGWPRGDKQRFRQPNAELFDGAEFMLSLAPSGEGPDPLQEDWDWVRSDMATLLELGEEFARQFAAAKRELGAADFHDLEQFALELLWRRPAGQLTPIAERWRERLDLVLVDEYQDINAAQDKIIQALSREGEGANRFVVGDVKQSIYRFRLADPRVFQGYAATWKANPAQGLVIPLADNFRSHAAILNFVNPLFAGLMRPEVGGVAYDEEAWLRFGNAAERQHYAAAPPLSINSPNHQLLGASPRVELLLRLTSKEELARDEDAEGAPAVGGAFADHTKTEQEAWLLAARLRELQQQGFQVWDEEKQALRPAAWRDMVILLRAPRDKAEDFAKIFNRAGVPLVAARRGLYQTTEVTDLLSVLMLLDNPLQDVPALAALRSPLAGLTLNELAVIRLHQRRGSFWSALRRFHRAKGVPADQPGGGQRDSEEGAESDEAGATEQRVLSSPPNPDLNPIPDQETPAAAEGAKRLDCAGLPALSDAAGAHESGGKLPHSKRFAPETTQAEDENEGRGGVSTQDADTPNQPAAAGEADPVIAAACASAWSKVDAFLEKYARWRELARRGALSHCLESVLEESHYEDWLLAQERGEERRANVELLLASTRQFDQFQRQGLYRFLKFVEAQQAAEFDPEPAALNTANAVRLMSIHQSKGLEFPIVVVADLGRRFNLEELRAPIILDEVYGLCPLVKPPTSAQAYPSLPHWLAAQRQRREALGEELRLFYVAMTRACDYLILTGMATRKRAEADWSGPGQSQLSAKQILAATDGLDWLGPMVSTLAGSPDWLGQARGQAPLLTWRLVSADDLGPMAPTQPPDRGLGQLPDLATLAAQHAQLTWEYPYGSATIEPAKTSVSALRRRVPEESDDEARRLFGFPHSPPVGGEGKGEGVRLTVKGDAGRRGTARRRKLSAVEIGLAHHRFLQFVAFDQVGSETGLRAEAERLAQTGALNAAEAGALDLAALAGFWSSELGLRIRAHAAQVQRELQFTARFSPADLAAVGVPIAPGLPAEEFIVVQGVADLVVVRPAGLWLLDFKTDDIGAAELAEKVRDYQPQLALYALALGRIYGRPVTEAWLHFLALNQTVRVQVGGVKRDA